MIVDPEFTDAYGLLLPGQSVGIQQNPEINYDQDDIIPQAEARHFPGRIHATL